MIGKSPAYRKAFYATLQGTTNDSSVNGNNATATSNITSTTGILGQSDGAYTYTATNGYIQYSNTVANYIQQDEDNTTLYLNFKLADITKINALVSMYGTLGNRSLYLAYRGDFSPKTLRCVVYENDNNLPTPYDYNITLNTTDWNTLMITFDGVINGNINGTEFTLATYSSIKDTAQTFRVGETSAGGNYARGSISNIRILKTLLSKGNYNILNNEKGRIGLPKKLLLDNYSGSAAAYSLRKLRYNYSSSAIRVRRASDNAEQDIGFVSNELDTTSLASFCSGTNGFVVTWYDQSGNSRNATQTTTANQPKIYDSSTGVLLVNNKPALLFDGTDDFLTLGTAITKPARYSVFSLQKANNTATTYNATGSSNAGLAKDGFGSIRYQTNNKLATYWGDGSSYRIYQTTATSQDTNQNIINILYDSGLNIYIYKNNTSLGLSEVVGGSATTCAGTTYAYTLGLSGIGSGSPLNGNIQEHIIYTSYEGANVNGINTNINNYYGIY